ncbi:lecithin retinol acyltransferase family protein [Pseudomonas putida]|uniref:lecithin retinol acyltransferase family protein n=1 Tax=Pseudomonas putida TaxID=303 RepID=UPI0026C95597
MKSLIADVEQALPQIRAGSHLITSRKFYIHHGIYLGEGRVAHYAGYSGSFTPGPIEVTDLEQFANGRPVWILEAQSEYSSEEIVRRAYSRVGERHYRIFSNNCEHFCNWCTRGESRSAQVELLLHSPRGFFSMISALESSLIA